MAGICVENKTEVGGIAKMQYNLLHHNESCPFDTPKLKPQVMLKYLRTTEKWVPCRVISHSILAFHSHTTIEPFNYGEIAQASLSLWE